MKDGQGRTIDYLRISVTDRCDLRCVYCMPECGVPSLSHETVLRYEEILRLARIFAVLGIRKIRLTGGEPLIRKGLAQLVAALSTVSGIETIAMTTNGMLLSDMLPQLLDAGLSSVNISLDTLDEAVFTAITRRSGLKRVLDAIDRAAAVPTFGVKLNCVPTELNRNGIPALTAYAAERSLPLRFIELMPIGEGRNIRGLCEAEVSDILENAFGPLSPIVPEAPDKCRRFLLPGGGEIGFISPMSHKFCAQCSRIRLTADGKLKTCLQYDVGADLRALLSEDDASISEAIAQAILHKPLCHHFGEAASHTDTRKMFEIGG